MGVQGHQTGQTGRCGDMHRMGGTLTTCSAQMHRTGRTLTTGGINMLIADYEIAHKYNIDESIFITPQSNFVSNFVNDSVWALR